MTDKQHIADRLTAELGRRVIYGIYQSIDDKTGVKQPPRELYVFEDGAEVDQAAIDAASAWAEANPPPPAPPTLDERVAALEARVDALESPPK